MALCALEFHPSCDEARRLKLLSALADSQRRSGDTVNADSTYLRATDLARRLAEAEQRGGSAALALPMISSTTEMPSVEEKRGPLSNGNGGPEIRNCALGQSSHLDNLKNGCGAGAVLEIKGDQLSDITSQCLITERLVELEPVGAAEVRPGEEMEEVSSGLSGCGIFRREGEYWTIVYENQTVRIRHSKGMAYIAYLIGHTGRELHVIDLASLGESDRLETRSIRSIAGEADTVLGDAGPVLDSKAKASYRQRLRELREELEEARSLGDLGRLSKLEMEIEFLSRELARAVGLGGRDRRVGSEVERARLRVTNAVKSAIKRIMKQCPSLGQLLSRSIRTGYVCSFDQAIAFQVSS